MGLKKSMSKLAKDRVAKSMKKWAKDHTGKGSDNKKMPKRQDNDSDASVERYMKDPHYQPKMDRGIIGWYGAKTRELENQDPGRKSIKKTKDRKRSETPKTQGHPSSHPSAKRDRKKPKIMDHHSSDSTPVLPQDHGLFKTWMQKNKKKKMQSKSANEFQTSRIKGSY